MILHGFFRSSAAWRVRIALAIKGLDHQGRARNFRKNEQRSADFLKINPQGLVPALVTGDGIFTQSLAIVEYLDELHPSPPLLASDPVARAHIRSMAQLIACDIHPIDNLRVLAYLREVLKIAEPDVNDWYRHWVGTGLEALEQQVIRFGDGRHCYGGNVTLADICLVPQLYNARRFETDLSPYPTLVAIDAHLQTLPAFAQAVPERQPDAV